MGQLHPLDQTKTLGIIYEFRFSFTTISKLSGNPSDSTLKYTQNPATRHSFSALILLLTSITPWLDWCSNFLNVFLPFPLPLTCNVLQFSQSIRIKCEKDQIILLLRTFWWLLSTSSQTSQSISHGLPLPKVLSMTASCHTSPCTWDLFLWDVTSFEFLFKLQLLNEVSHNPIV